MICCLSICSHGPSSSQLNDPKETLGTGREKHADVTGNEGVSLTEFVFFPGLGQLWLNGTRRGFFERRQKLSAETRRDFISPSVYVCSVAYMPTY